MKTRTKIVGAIVASISGLHAQSYSNGFETASDLDDFTITSATSFSVDANGAWPPITGQSAYLRANSEIATPSTFVLKPSTGVFANFQNTGDKATFSIFHAGTGSENSAGVDFFQFLGFENAGTYLGVYGDHGDSDPFLAPGGELGIATGGLASGFTPSILGSPFGDSGSLTSDDLSWNRFSADITYDAASNTFRVDTKIENYGTLGVSTPTLIASRSTSGVPATGFDNTDLLPSFALLETQNAKEAYENFEFTFVPVPEPSSMLLMGVGVIGLVTRRKRG